MASWKRWLEWAKLGEVQTANQARKGVTSMPHYFFDLTDNKIVHDFKGKQLANHDQARLALVGGAFLIQRPPRKS
jgi:hypothetical protein